MDVHQSEGFAVRVALQTLSVFAHLGIFASVIAPAAVYWLLFVWALPWLLQPITNVTVLVVVATALFIVGAALMLVIGWGAYVLYGRRLLAYVKNT